MPSSTIVRALSGDSPTNNTRAPIVRRAQLGQLRLEMVDLTRGRALVHQLLALGHEAHARGPDQLEQPVLDARMHGRVDAVAAVLEDRRAQRVHERAQIREHQHRAPQLLDVGLDDRAHGIGSLGGEIEIEGIEQRGDVAPARGLALSRIAAARARHHPCNRGRGDLLAGMLECWHPSRPGDVPYQVT